MPAKLRSLNDAFVHELRDILGAEKQVVKALRMTSRRASSEELRTALAEHLDQTEGQIGRIERAFQSIGETVRAKSCAAMTGILEEGVEALRKADTDILDAMLIGISQKVEHYEIAAYGTLCSWAKELGHEEAGMLLHQNLDEEKQADERLVQIAGRLNQRVA
jgi:ferritin-like metal-binding protein YciE